LLPVGIASVDGLARASRRNEPVLRTLAWVLARSLPFLAALLLAYLMALLDLVPSPEFPFDPRREPFDLGAGLALLALTGAFGAALFFTRTLATPAAAGEAIAPSVGLVLFVAAMLVWLANPYFALLLAPAVHLWTGAALPELRGLPVVPLVAAALGLLLPLVALGALASYLAVGVEVPWQLLLMFTGGHFGLPAAIPLCVLGGCLVAVIELGLPGRAPRPTPGLPGGRPLGRHAGPGSLGGPPSGSRWTQVLVPNTNYGRVGCR
jgi:hypothetical protein